LKEHVDDNESERTIQITISVFTLCDLPDVHVCVTLLGFIMLVAFEAYQHATKAKTSLQSKNFLVVSILFCHLRAQ